MHSTYAPPVGTQTMRGLPDSEIIGIALKDSYSLNKTTIDSKLPVPQAPRDEREEGIIIGNGRSKW